MIKSYSFNEYGTRISVHECEFCGCEFSVCPAIMPEKAYRWRGCMHPSCSSYDPARDGEKLFDQDGKTTKLTLTGLPPEDSFN